MDEIKQKAIRQLNLEIYRTLLTGVPSLGSAFILGDEQQKKLKKVMSVVDYLSLDCD